MAGHGPRRGRRVLLRDRRVLGAASTTLLFFLAFRTVYIYLATTIAPASGQRPAASGHRPPAAGRTG
ncbi:hypothetical protein [Kitasatospora purpeofusca]|uniref:hypothetical protein n=1 Tax=Kitasatospora purpeofusca TaxID=67352 RepID=UPI002A5A2A59|nr:hypothetical protein [Kitasatospora purpeofusca]MDY0814636.1 hypothetical protein [Kitasatospora purpeofusca]